MNQDCTSKAIKFFVCLFVSSSHEGWWKNFHPVSDRVIIMPPMLRFLCCWCLPFNRDGHPQFVFSLCTVQAVFSETRFGQIWCHKNVSKMLGFSSPQFRGQLLWSLSCLVSPPVTYEHFTVNNCMRKWDLFLLPFTSHCLISPPVTYEHFTVNNRRSSEIQGTALGKCLWSWSCIQRSRPAGVALSRHAFVGGTVCMWTRWRIPVNNRQKKHQKCQSSTHHSWGTCWSDSRFSQLVV